jgi:hypothetical protein
VIVKVAVFHQQFKHMFEGVVILSPGRGRNRTYVRSNICSTGGAMAYLPARAFPARPLGRLHLTRRGRLVILLISVLVLFGFFSLGRVSTQAAPPGGRLQLRTLVVQSGQTLWGIATRVAPGADPRQTITELTALNHLSRPVVTPGEVLVLPGLARAPAAGGRS